VYVFWLLKMTFVRKLPSCQNNPRLPSNAAHFNVYTLMNKDLAARVFTRPIGFLHSLFFIPFVLLQPVTSLDVQGNNDRSEILAFVRNPENLFWQKHL